MSRFGLYLAEGVLRWPPPFMEHTPPPCPPRNCRIEPGLEAKPAVMRLAALTEQYLNKGLARIVTRASLVLPPYPIVPAAPPKGPAADAFAEERAACQGASLAELDRLARHMDELVREAVASNPKTPANTLARLAVDPVPLVLWAVARHPNLGLDGQTRLAEPRLGVRNALAANPSLDRSVALCLANAMEVEVRRSLAGNRCVPPDLLERLAADSDARVRGVAALNPSTPEPALARLAEDADEAVRAAVGFNRPAERAAYEPWTEEANPTLKAYSLFEGGMDAYFDDSASTAYFVMDRLETVEQAVALFMWLQFGEGEE